MKGNLTNQFKEMFDGLMLGDGHLSKNILKKYNSRFVINQSIKHENFIQNISSSLIKNGFKTSIRMTKHRFSKFHKKDIYSIYLQTNTSEFFNEQRERWYKNNKKLIPNDIILSPITIAYWFMCDGWSQWLKNTDAKVLACFSTDSFALEEIEMIAKQLTQFRIEYTITKKHKSYQITISKSDSVMKLMKLIEPLIIECFEYKLKFPKVSTFSEASIKRVKMIPRNTKTGRFYKK